MMCAEYNISQGNFAWENFYVYLPSNYCEKFDSFAQRLVKLLTLKPIRFDKLHKLSFYETVQDRTWYRWAFWQIDGCVFQWHWYRFFHALKRTYNTVGYPRCKVYERYQRTGLPLFLDIPQTDGNDAGPFPVTYFISRLCPPEVSCYLTEAYRRD